MDEESLLLKVYALLPYQAIAQLLAIAKFASRFYNLFWEPCTDMTKLLQFLFWIFQCFIALKFSLFLSVFQQLRS